LTSAPASNKTQLALGACFLLLAEVQWCSTMARCWGIHNGDNTLLKAAREGEWTSVELEDGVNVFENAHRRGAGKFGIVIE
jgi:hypothetical protein